MPKWYENGEWRRLHNEEIHNLYCSPKMIKVIKSKILRWAGHVARMEEGRSDFKVFAVKSTGMRPLGRLMHRREENIRRDGK